MKKPILSLCLLGALSIYPAHAQDVGELILKGYVPNTTINPYAGGTIGLVGPYQMSLALVDHLRRGRLPGCRHYGREFTAPGKLRRSTGSRAAGCRRCPRLA